MTTATLTVGRSDVTYAPHGDSLAQVRVLSASQVRCADGSLRTVRATQPLKPTPYGKLLAVGDEPIVRCYVYVHVQGDRSVRRYGTLHRVIVNGHDTLVFRQPSHVKQIQREAVAA